MKLPIDVIFIIVAIFGGIAKYLDTFLHGNEKVTFARAISYVIVCAFTGWIAGEITLLMYPNWALIASGVGGYAGTQVMDLAVEILRIKLGAKNIDEVSESDKPFKKK